MKCLSILLVYLLNIRNEKGFYTITNEFYLKNKFNFDDPVQYKAREMYLAKINIVLTRAEKTYPYYSESCFPQKSTDYGYILVDYSLFKSIISNIKSHNDHKFLWKIFCWFSGREIDRPYEYRDYYKEQLQEFVTYKFLKEEPTNKNIIELGCTENVNCMEYVKDMFAELICMNPLKLNQYIKYLEKTNSRKIEDNADLHLCFYKDYFTCLKKLKVLIKDLRCLKLVKNNSKKKSIDETTTLKVSKFRECLNRRFNVNKQQRYFGDNNNDILWEISFEKCFNYLTDEIQKNNIILLMGDKYDTEFYIKKLGGFIFDAVDLRQNEYARPNPDGKAIVFTEIVDSLEKDLKRLQNWVVRDRHDYDYDLKHFSKLIKQEVGLSNNYIEIEKMIFDCYNMFIFIFNSCNTLKGEKKYSYVPLIYNDDFNLSVIDGIQVVFKKPVKFKQIKGFGDKEEEYIMEQDTDFFFDKFNRLNFTSDVLKLNKIKEIEIMFAEKDTDSIRFKISDYLQVW